MSSLPTVRLKLKLGPPPTSSALTGAAQPPTSTQSTTPSSATALSASGKKKKGNGWTATARRRTATNANSSQPSKKFRKSLADVLTTALGLFKKRDTYGFFLEPVDTEAVPDYLTVIKHPMDFGTIEKRISDRFYTSIDEFQRDVELVCTNCKTYNAPNTLYHKIASQIQKFSSNYLNRIKQSTTIVNSDPPTRSETPVPVPPVLSSAAEPKWKYASKHKKRKQQRRETMDDGSLALGYWYLAYLGQTSAYRMKASEREAEQEERVLESWRFVPKLPYPYYYAGMEKEEDVLAGWLAEEVDDVRNGDVFLSPYEPSVSFNGYTEFGPYEQPTLVPALLSTGAVHPALASMRIPTLVPIEKELMGYWTETYGDFRAAVYRDSMMTFVKDMPEYVQERVLKKMDTMSDCADGVVRMVETAFEDVKKGQDVEFVLRRVVVKAQQAQDEKQKQVQQETTEEKDEAGEEEQESSTHDVNSQHVFVEYHTDEEDDDDDSSDDEMSGEDESDDQEEDEEDRMSE